MTTNRNPQSPSRAVVLDGYFGMQNAGDDAFCVVGSEILRRLGISQIVYHSRPSVLPVLPHPAHTILPTRPRFKGQYRAASILGMLRHRTVVHLGGSTFRRLNRHRRDQLALVRTRAIKLHAVAVSVGPFRNEMDRSEVARFLSHFTSVSVRDEASLDRLVELGLPVPIQRAFDVAVLLPTLRFVDTSSLPALRRREGDQPVLGVSVRPLESVEGGDPRIERKRLANIARLLDQVVRETKSELRFIVMNDHPVRGDEPLINELIGQLGVFGPRRVVPYGGDVRHTLEAISGCHALLGMRLHSAIFAYALRVPFAVMDYHPKCAEFHRDVGGDAEMLLSGTADGPQGPPNPLLDALTGSSYGQADLVPITTAQQWAMAAFDFLADHLSTSSGHGDAIARTMG